MVLVPRYDSRPKGKSFSQLGRFVYELSTIRFSKLGLVFLSETGGSEIGECLRIATVEYGRAARNVQRGPFLSAKEYYSVLADIQAHEIWNSNLFGRLFFDPLPMWEEWQDWFKDQSYRAAVDAWNERMEHIFDTIENKLDYKIFADILAEMIPEMEHDPRNEGFPLEHSDLGIQNIFVDDEFNITCIIDWELCSTLPLETLITHAPLPCRSCIPTELDEKAFESGFRAEEAKVDPDCPSSKVLQSSQARRDFDRVMHEDERIDDCRRFQRLFA